MSDLRIVAIPRDLYYHEVAYVRRLERALESIAANGCCDRCQEAALVAKKALRGDVGDARDPSAKTSQHPGASSQE